MPSLSLLYLAIILYKALNGGVVQFADDPGVGWHMQTGNWILSNSAVPANDPFLISRLPWISDQWLGDLIFASLNNLFGFQGLCCVVAAIYFGTFLYLLPKFLLKSYTSLTLFIALISLQLAGIHFILRPVVLSFPLFLITLSLCRDLFLPLKEKLNIKYFNKVVQFFIIFIIWANIHPSFVLGLGVIAVLLLLMGFQQRQVPYKILGILSISFLATLINPYFYHLHWSILFLGQSNYFLSLNQEWLPLDFNRFEGNVLVGISIIIFIGLLLKASINAFDAVLSIIFAYLTVCHLRFLPYLGIIISPLFLKSLMCFEEINLPRIYPFKLSTDFLLKVKQIEKQQKFLLLKSIFVTILGFIIYYNNFPTKPGSGGSPPLDGLSFIKKLASNNIVLSHPDFGGSITYYLWPSSAAVIDDRNTMLGEEFYKHFFKAMKCDGNWQEYAKEKSADIILWPASKEFTKCLREKLPVLYEDKHSVVFRVIY